MPGGLYAREDGGASRSAGGALFPNDEADGMHLYREKGFVFPLKQREPPHLPKTFSTPNALFRF